MSITRHLDCGCYARRLSSSGPGHPPIVLCPLHAQAEGLWESLKAIVTAYDCGDGPMSKYVGKARAILRAMEGK